MISTTLYALCFAALAASQSSSSTVSLFLPNADYMSSLVGSISTADASSTVYVIGCASPTSSSMAAATTGANFSSVDDGDFDDGCGFDGSQTITQGPSTFHWVLTEVELSAEVTVDCKLSGTTEAICAETATGSAFSSAAPSGLNDTDGIPPLTTATLTGSDFPPYQQVVITAGLSNIKASGSSSTGSVTSTGTAAPSAKSTSKSSSGTIEVEPALVMGAAGMLAVGLAAFAL